MTTRTAVPGDVRERFWVRRVEMRPGPDGEPVESYPEQVNVSDGFKTLMAAKDAMPGFCAAERCHWVEVERVISTYEVDEGRGYWSSESDWEFDGPKAWWNEDTEQVVVEHTA